MLVLRGLCLAECCLSITFEQTCMNEKDAREIQNAGYNASTVELLDADYPVEDYKDRLEQARTLTVESLMTMPLFTFYRHYLGAFMPCDSEALPTTGPRVVMVQYGGLMDSASGTLETIEELKRAAAEKLVARLRVCPRVILDLSYSAGWFINLEIARALEEIKRAAPGQVVKFQTKCPIRYFYIRELWEPELPNIAIAPGEPDEVLITVRSAL